MLLFNRLAGPLRRRPGTRGAHGFPVPHVHWRGGPRERRDHLHLQTLCGGAGQRGV